MQADGSMKMNDSDILNKSLNNPNELNLLDHGPRDTQLSNSFSNKPTDRELYLKKLFREKATRKERNRSQTDIRLTDIDDMNL